jgi:hypothetical protein
MINKTIRIRLTPTLLRVLAQLGIKTGLRRNNVIRYAIARLAEREGVPMSTSSGRAAQRKRLTHREL